MKILKILISSLALLLLVSAFSYRGNSGAYGILEFNSSVEEAAYIPLNAMESKLLYRSDLNIFRQWDGSAWSNFAAGAQDGVISNVALNGSNLDFTGSNGGFNSSVDLSSLSSGGSSLWTDDLDGTISYQGATTVSVSSGAARMVVTRLNTTASSLVAGGSGSAFRFSDNGDFKIASQPLADVLSGAGASSNNIFQVDADGDIYFQSIRTYASTAAAAADATLLSNIVFKVSNGDGTASIHIKE